jgi:hypothetical protein
MGLYVKIGWKLAVQDTKVKKTLVGGAILNYSSILKYRKKVTSTIIFLFIDVFKSNILND